MSLASTGLCIQPRAQPLPTHHLPNLQLQHLTGVSDDLANVVTNNAVAYIHHDTNDIKPESSADAGTNQMWARDFRGKGGPLYIDLFTPSRLPAALAMVPSSPHLSLYAAQQITLPRCHHHHQPQCLNTSSTDFEGIRRGYWTRLLLMPDRTVEWRKQRPCMRCVWRRQSCSSRGLSIVPVMPQVRFCMPTVQ